MLENPYLNLNEVGLNGINAIWIATYANQLPILIDINEASKLRNRPIDLLARNKEGINSLHLASYYNNVDIAGYFAAPEIPFDVN